MGQGELDQLSMVIGRLEGRVDAGITTLTDAVKDIGEKFTEVATAVHSHGERLEKVESTAKTLYDHHTGRTAIVRFIKLLPWAVIWGAAGTMATNWKSIVGMMH